MYTRRLTRPEGTALLLGPRATGKSTWIEEVLPKATRFDLLDTRLAREFAAQPELFARDAQVARPTVQGYFEVLVDTLLGFWLPAWKLKPATKLVAHPKFYFFDAGVARALTGRLAYPPTREELSPLFETYLLHEVRAYLSYAQLEYPLGYLRTHHGVEVDLVLETAKGHLALEFKLSERWDASFNAGFARLRDELRNLRCVGVFTGARAQRGDGVDVLPHAEFLGALWSGGLIV